MGTVVDLNSLGLGQPSSTREDFLRVIKKLENLIINTHQSNTVKITHDDILPFSFAPLENIREDLAVEGYTSEEIDREIRALSELPQYAKDSQRNKSS